MYIPHPIETSLYSDNLTLETRSVHTAHLWKQHFDTCSILQYYIRCILKIVPASYFKMHPVHHHIGENIYEASAFFLARLRFFGNCDVNYGTVDATRFIMIYIIDSQVFETGNLIKNLKAVEIYKFCLLLLLI